MQARRNALAYRFGNNASEGEIQTNKDYRVANPVVNIKTEERSRSATSGAVGSMSDYTALDHTAETSMTWIVVSATGSQAFRAQIDQRDMDYISAGLDRLPARRHGDRAARLGRLPHLGPGAVQHRRRQPVRADRRGQGGLRRVPRQGRRHRDRRTGG